MATNYASQQPRGSKNHIEDVAIVGAGGEQGSFITNALLKQGKHKITAITRPDSTNKLPEGIHIIKKASYNDHAALVDALKGQDMLIITLNVMAAKDSQNRLVDAAVDAGVRYIMPNEWGGDYSNPALQETFTGTAATSIREYIEKVGKGKTYWIALTCSFWYEFSLAGGEIRYGFDFANKKVTFFDDGSQKICTSTWPKTGLAVAKLLTLPILPKSAEDTKTLTLSHWHNRAVYITSFVVSQRDMLSSILRVTGDKESDWKITHEDSQARFKRGDELVKSGTMMGFAVMLYSRMFFPSGDGDYSEKVENELLGLEEEDLDDATGVAVKYAEEGLISNSDRANVKARETAGQS